MSEPTRAVVTNLRDALLRDGYVVVPGVVPAALCDAVSEAMAHFVGVDLDNPASWRNCQMQGHGIVPLHHHASLWTVRQHPALHAAFAAIYGTPRLWVTLDRCSFKLPRSLRDVAFRMDPVHWDRDPHIGSLGVQGLVYLSDTPAEQGAFAAVPSLYRELDDWLATPRDAAAIARPNIGDHALEAVPGRQGDLVIWHRRMPHTSLANDGDRPRLVQYVAMDPLPAANDERYSAARELQARLCRERRPPAWAVRQNVPGQLDPEPGPDFAFSPLGRRLAGLDEWPADELAQ